MNILYLHGMASSHLSETAAYLRKYLPEHRIVVPDLSIDPAISFSLIDRLIREEKIDLLVGHSLGGFMAQKYTGMKKVLVNPCLGTSFFRLFLGRNRYKHSRYDGIPFYVVTPAICAAYKRMERAQFDSLTSVDDDRTIGLFARYDLYTRLSAHRFKRHYTHRRLIAGRHFPTEATVRDFIVPAIRVLLDCGGSPAAESGE